MERHAVEPAAASEALWNRVEKFEKQGRAARPRGQNSASSRTDAYENIALTREFVTEQLAARGFPADWAIHDGKGGNHIHAHILLTMRPLAEDGFGIKRVPCETRKRGRRSGMSAAHPLDFGNTWGGRSDLIELRKQWADYANLHLARAGHESASTQEPRGCRARCHADGAQGRAGQRDGGRGQPLERIEDFEEARAKGAREIAERPERVLELITDRQAVFTRRDIAREIIRYVDEGAAFQAILARVMASPGRQLAPEEGRRRARFSRGDGPGRARYDGRGPALAPPKTHGVGPAQWTARWRGPGLWDEQRGAVRH